MHLVRPKYHQHQLANDERENNHNVLDYHHKLFVQLVTEDTGIIEQKQNLSNEKQKKREIGRNQQINSLSRHLAIIVETKCNYSSVIKNKNKKLLIRDYLSKLPSRFIQETRIAERPF